MSPAVREAVLARCRGFCEACHSWLSGRGAVDHFLGGIGRRQQQERVESVWVLCLRCNEARTANRPDAAYWNERFRAHAEKHGYEVLAHKDLGVFRRRGLA